jgi:hypothetical protein
MREDLLGYLLGALEPDEEREIEDRLEADPELRKKLRVIRRGLEPLSSDDGLIDAPEGLAARTCSFVDQFPTFEALGTHAGAVPAGDNDESDPVAAPANVGAPVHSEARHSEIPHAQTPDSVLADAITSPAAAAVAPMPASLSPVSGYEAAAPDRRWSMADALVTAGVVAAASMLIVPAISAGRYQAQITACTQRLQRLGTALVDYSRIHGGAFPEVVEHGPMSRAGIYPVRLREAKLISDYSEVTCPAAHHEFAPQAATTASITGSSYAGPSGTNLHRTAEADATDVTLRIPEPAELEEADDAEVDALLARHRGTYGYALGYVDDDGYHVRRNQNRSTFIVLSDMPHDGKSGSRNHGCGGQNVWFEDGHVEFLNTCRLKHLEDQIFENRSGFVGAGEGPDDIVIGRATDRPLITPVGFSQ